jgi:hypothetical protein
MRTTAIVGIISILLGAFLGYRLSPTKTITQQVVKTVEVEKVVTKKIVVSKETRPDGSTVEKTESTDIVMDKTADKQAVVPMAIKRTEWALGLDWSTGGYLPIGASVDRRLAGDWWLSAGALWKDKPLLTLGVRYEY